MAKNGTMTHRERVEAVLRRQKPDRVPSWPIIMGFTTVYTGTTIGSYYNKPEVAMAALKKTAEDFDFILWPFTGCAASLAWEFGGDMKWPTGDFAQAPTVTRYPVEKPEDVFKLEVPNVKTAGFAPIGFEFYKLAAQERLDNEPFNVTNMIGGPFTLGANIPGAEMFSKWLLKRPEAAHRLLRLATDYLHEYAQIVKNMFGIDGVIPFVGEPTSANQIISPKQFEDFVVPYTKELCDKVLDMGYKHIYVHICGEQNLNLPQWAKINFGDPGIIGTPHEIELEKMAEYFPDDVILGNLEPAIIQSGTVDEVYEATRAVVEKGKALKNGYIFCQGCELPPMAPVENVKAMQQAVEDYGWYD